MPPPSRFPSPLRPGASRDRGTRRRSASRRSGAPRRTGQHEPPPGLRNCTWLTVPSPAAFTPDASSFRWAVNAIRWAAVEVSIIPWHDRERGQRRRARLLGSARHRDRGPGPPARARITDSGADGGVGSRAFGASFDGSRDGPDTLAGGHGWKGHGGFSPWSHGSACSWGRTPAGLHRDGLSGCGPSSGGCELDLRERRRGGNALGVGVGYDRLVGGGSVRGGPSTNRNHTVQPLSHSPPLRLPVTVTGSPGTSQVVVGLRVRPARG